MHEFYLKKKNGNNAYSSSSFNYKNTKIKTRRELYANKKGNQTFKNTFTDIKAKIKE